MATAEKQSRELLTECLSRNSLLALHSLLLGKHITTGTLDMYCTHCVSDTFGCTRAGMLRHAH